MRRRILRVAVVLALVVAAGWVVHVRSSSGPHLVVPGDKDSSASGRLGKVGAGQYRAAYFGSLCLSEPGSATIRSIEPVDPHGGLSVTDFSSVVNDGTILGVAKGRLRDEQSYHGSHRMTTTCPALADLFVEVRKPTSAGAWASDFRVHYVSDGHDRSVRLRYGFGLCPGSGDCTASRTDD